MAFDKNEIATLASVVKKGFEEGIKDLHTSLPGIIQTFDPATQLASIQPAIKRIFIARESEEDILIPSDLPLLINVPIIYPRGGGFSLTFPVKQGDECLLVFCERSIDNWHQFGGVKDPIARRFHSLSDAVAYVGLSSLVNKVPNYNANDTELKSDNGNVIFTIREDGTSTLKSTVSVTIDTPETTMTGNLTVNGNTKIDGTLEVDGKVTANDDLEVALASILSATVTSNSKDISDTHSHAGSPTAPSGAQSNTGNPV